LTQDGYTSGSLTGLTINNQGQVITNYSNGQTQVQGVLVLADFRNTQGLTSVGGGNYVETLLSGTPVIGTPGIGKFGDIRAGALEDSNVDLTGELVNMMVAQRNYQANAQTIKTQDQVLSTLVNLR
jgi:flagellar hook protein FlgE